jgi:hypothetical protein
MPQQRAQVRGRFPAFTLVEMVLTLAVTSILLLSLTSVMRILGKAVPQGGDATERALELASLVDRVRLDVELATGILEVDDEELSLVVGDRDGDTNPETLIYSYDDEEQTVLLSVNGGGAIPLATGIVGFAFETRTSTQSHPSAPALQWTTPSRLVSVPMVSSSGDNCHQTELVGLIVTPTVPIDATAWRIARVECFMRRLNNVPVVTAAVRGLTAAGLPTGTALQSVTQTLNSLSNLTATQQTFTFTTMASLLPTQRAAVIFSTSTTANGVEIPTIQPIPTFHSDFVKRSGSGAWQVDEDEALAMTVWVQFQVPVASTTTITAIDAIDLLVRDASGITMQVPMVVRTAPEVP